MVCSSIQRLKRAIAAIVPATCLVVGFTGCLKAQTASQITPKSFAPPVEAQVGHGLSLGTTPGLDSPPGAEKLFVSLSGVSLEGGFAVLSDEEQQLRRKLMGQRVSGTEIFAAARVLEGAYARAGFVLVRVVLPPQTLDDGAVLKLRIVDGYISRIDTSHLPKHVRRRVAALVKPLEGVRGLRLKTIERRILLASDVPGVVLRSSFMPGAETGETILVLNATYQPLTFQAGIDNSLGSALGSYQIFTGVDLNNALGLGEKTYLRVNGNPGGKEGPFFGDYPLNRSLAAGMILPVGPDGMTLNLEGTDTKAAPRAVDGVRFADGFQRFSLRLRYAWIRSRNAGFSSQVVFDAQREVQSLIDPTSARLFEDRLRVLRLSQEGYAITPGGGVLSGGVNTSFGIAGLGARRAPQAAASVPLSRQGASPGFTKIDAAIDYSQSLARHLGVHLNARGQYAFAGAAMERAEQFGIAGVGGLSAFDAGSLQGDSGLVARAEVSSPFAVPRLFRQHDTVLAPYVFVAGGKLFVNYPTAVEPDRIKAGAYGVGLRANDFSPRSEANRSLSLEFARQVRSHSQDEDSRATIALSFAF